MKSCQHFHEWLESAERLSLNSVPEDLQQHLSGCRACSDELQTLMEVRACALNIAPAPSEMEMMWSRIDKNIRGEKLAPPTGEKPFSLESILTGLVEHLSARMLPVSAVVLIALVLLTFWSFWSGGGAQIGKVSGSGASLSSAGLSRALTAAAVPCRVSDRLTLSNAQSWVEIAFAAGPGVFVEGDGQLQLTDEGFKTETGRFKATFKKINGIMRVAVPGAVLGIRGTTIQFSLNNGEGDIKLIEGRVEVFPDDGKPFEWKAENILRITGGKLSPEPLPATEKVSEPIDLRHRSSEY